MRHTLICTVGTSLLNNLNRENEEVQKLKAQENWNQLSLWLFEQENTSRVCGAEINSISSILSKGLLDQTKKLIFLVSDTDDGRNTGQILNLYYNNNRNPVRFKEVEYRILEGLRDDNVKAFKQDGLRNLVKEISKEARTFDPSSIAINATGGYKAQISFAGMVGQALEIPVYYLFEKFSEVIALPPQPVSLDLAFWLNHYIGFSDLETGNTVSKQEIELPWDDERLSALVDEEEIDDLSYVTLSAMGVLFHERSQLQFARQKTAMLSLIPQDETSPEQKTIKLRDDHGKDKLQDFSKKLCRSPYVKQIVNSLPFNPKQVDPIRRTTEEGLVEFVLTSPIQ
ncbi:CRISPR-associated protein, partial [Leptolyngbya valderiana BDU 20041]